MEPNEKINGGRAFASGSKVAKLGAFLLDIEQRTLLRDGKRINIPPKTFELLLYLTENRDRIIDKREILDQVWNGAFVEESNLSVHISTLRKIFASDTNQLVSIETFPKIGYRFVADTQDDAKVRVNGQLEELPSAIAGQRPDKLSGESTESPRSNERMKRHRRPLPTLVSVAVPVLIVLAAIVFLFERRGESRNVLSPKSDFTWTRAECPKDAPSTNLEIGGCEDAVTAFTLDANPNGNWAYGYSPNGKVSEFSLFEKANHNNHYASPEVPVDFWTRKAEWHPLILKNTSSVTVVIQGGVIVPPNMFEMHPGPKGERSVLRWIAPADGLYRIQGQFRGINAAGMTTTDALVVENGSTVRFSAGIVGFNLEHPFDLELHCRAGGTIDFSLGYGDGKYEGDSTGFSAIVTTLSLGSVDK